MIDGFIWSLNENNFTAQNLKHLASTCYSAVRHPFNNFTFQHPKLLVFNQEEALKQPCVHVNDFLFSEILKFLEVEQRL